MSGNLIATSLPPIDATTLPFYAGAAYGLFKAGRDVYDFWRKRKDGHRAEIAHAAEGATRTREEAEHLIAIQEKTIARLDTELAAAARREAEAIRLKVAAEEAAAEAEEKLTTASRQWFERQGWIADLERRLADLERVKD